MSTATVLVIDDEQMICDLLRSVFTCHGYEVLTATNGGDGLALFRQRRPRVTLLDLRMPDMDGIEVLAQIRTLDPKADVIMLTGRGTDVLEIQARGLGVTDFLGKGLPLEVVLRKIERVLRRTPKFSMTQPALAR